MELNKFQKFSPLFDNLYENKVVYSENVGTFIVVLNDLNVTPDRLEAKACIHIPIKKSRKLRKELKSWEIGGSWDGMRRLGTSLVAYSTWQIWTDAELVRKVEQLALENKNDEAIALLDYW